MSVLARTTGVAIGPGDVNGIVNLDWRFPGGDKEDTAWRCVPALRRVRPINPAKDSNGLLGAEISLDKGPYFDGTS